MFRRFDVHYPDDDHDHIEFVVVGGFDVDEFGAHAVAAVVVSEAVVSAR